MSREGWTSLTTNNRRRTTYLLTLNPQTSDQPTGDRPAPTKAATFADLGVSRGLVAMLARRGITEPFPVQALTIPDALAGRDVCGKARTGSGKTLAFGLPMIERTTRCKPRRPQALVLVPTRELASQVTNELAPLAAVRELRIAAVYGGMSLFRQAQAMRAGVEIVVATPGRLNDLLQRGDVSVADVTLAVIDEADQMADLGFLPQVERILDQIEHQHQTLLFSATLDGDIDRLVRKYQDNPVFHEAVSEEESPLEMKHRFLAVAEDEKVKVAADICAGPERTLLFVRTQRGADRLVKQLATEGVAAGAIHGGLSQPKRERALQSFARGTVPVLVATNIAARGIHVDGVDIVIHHDPPEDSKTYLHRSGRTARAGASGLVVTLVGPDQLRAVNILRRETGVRESVVPMIPGDLRLSDLAGWTPPQDSEHERTGSANGNGGGTATYRRNGGGGQRGGYQNRGPRPPQQGRWGSQPRRDAPVAAGDRPRQDRRDDRPSQGPRYQPANMGRTR
ncbi:MAG: DEAD/DEAH box helicase [Chloroflexi bacterium]|nr:DEAD/DEAH box helicase [Chloroflexota bacterium]